MHVIDAHIHLDLYKEEERAQLLSTLGPGVRGMITVSMNLVSCKMNQTLARQFPGLIFPAYGYHPEQAIPGTAEEQDLFKWIEANHNGMAAVGEVGLPYYNRKEAESKGEPFALIPYINLLEKFVWLAKKLDKPIVLHAVYEDATIAVDLLEMYRWKKAHFHWFKGNEQITHRMVENGYLFSVTPDVVYEEEIQNLVRQVPLEQLMVETDGPWPFEGPFEARMTHPDMIGESVLCMAGIKKKPVSETADVLLNNTIRFYRLV